MNQTADTAKQPAKKGRPRRPTMQPARIPPETLQQLDSLCAALNAIRPAGAPVVVKGRLAAEIIARYGAAYLADHAQQAAQRAQEALQGAQDAAPASAASAAPAAPQSAPQAAPHYFRCGQGAR